MVNSYYPAIRSKKNLVRQQMSINVGFLLTLKLFIVKNRTSGALNDGGLKMLCKKQADYGYGVTALIVIETGSG